MADTTATSAKKMYSLPMGHSHLSGRISARRKVKTIEGSLWLTMMRLPAPDEFSHPVSVELSSNVPLGEVGGNWSGQISIEGYPKKYDSRPDSDGMVHSIATAQMRLRVVEL